MSQHVILWVLLAAVIILLLWVGTLNERLSRVQKQLELVLSNFDGLREYLYEIDPQFDDERASDEEFQTGANIFAGYDDLKLLEGKRAAGKRTLNTPFHTPC